MVSVLEKACNINGQRRIRDEQRKGVLDIQIIYKGMGWCASSLELWFIWGG